MQLAGGCQKKCWYVYMKKINYSNNSNQCSSLFSSVNCKSLECQAWWYHNFFSVSGIFLNLIFFFFCLPSPSCHLSSRLLVWCKWLRIHSLSTLTQSPSSRANWFATERCRFQTVGLVLPPHHIHTPVKHSLLAFPSYDCLHSDPAEGYLPSALALVITDAVLCL